MTAQKTLTIEVDERTAVALRHRAQSRGQSVAEVVAELVESDGGAIDTSAAQIAELESRWDRFAKQSTAVPHHEVVRWLETWGTAENGPRPGR
jgi:predicted transcriptional regulator